MDVGTALRSTSKGQLKYDKYWVEEGRTKDMLDSISEYSTNISLSISPSILLRISTETIELENEEKKEPIAIASDEIKQKDASCDVTDSYLHELRAEKEIPILEYEGERLKYIQDVFNNKKFEFDHHSQELQQRVDQEYQLLKRKNELDAKRRAGDLQKIEETIMKEAKEKELLQKENYQTHAKKLSAKVLEAEMKHKRAEEELKKRQQEQEEFKLQLFNCQQEAQNLVCKAVEKLNFCEHPSFLRVTHNDRVNEMTKLLQSINAFVDQAKSKELTIDDILNANYLVKTIYEILQDIANDVELAKIKALREHEIQHTNSLQKEISMTQKQIRILEAARPSNAAVSTTDSPLSNISEQVKSENLKSSDNLDMELGPKPNEEAKKLLSEFIAPDAVEDYHRIMENLKLIEAAVQSFKTDPRNKRHRFEMQKAINIPINAVSSNSGSQVRSKISRLLSILNGNVPETSGSQMNSDSVVYRFCANLVAKQFVEQGDSQISAQYSTAFPIAVAVLGVWAAKPDVGSMILGHFYSCCPYLVPYYPPRQEGQSDKEYYMSLGYHFDKEDNMEEKYKFLNRMSGYMRLYAAIIQSALPPNSKFPHPHNITWGWKWLSRVLNMDPRPDITATLLYDFLDVAGHALQKTYGKQFKKIVHILCKDYFKKIKRVTPSGSGGPVERLETFLQQTAKKGYVSTPEGVLSSGFWNR